MCSLSSSLTASLQLPRQHQHLVSGYSQTASFLCESNVLHKQKWMSLDQMKHYTFTWSQMLWSYWSFHHLSLSPSQLVSSSLTVLLSFLLSPFCFIPAPRFLPILKPLPCIDFLSALLSSGVFRSSLWESILFNSCHTERFCSLSWGSGETLCQTEKRGRVESLHGCWLEAVYFPLSSSLASNRLWIWSLHI